MSIRGIDAQIMINRSQPLGQEVAGRERHMVNFQNYLADSEKLKSQENANKIAQMDKSEFNKIKPDQQKKERQGKQNNGQDQNQTTNGIYTEDSLFSAYDDESTIDIRI